MRNLSLLGFVTLSTAGLWGCADLSEPGELSLEAETETDATEARFDLGTGLDLPEAERAPTEVEAQPAPGGGVDAFHRIAPESAHAVGGADDVPPARIRPPTIALAGELCASSADCEAGTQCVADELGSDGEFRCLTVCVDPTAENSDAIACLDDDGCCEDAAVCDDEGTCVNPGGGGGSGGGSDPAADGGGCNQGCDFDRDDDGVVNSLDANPDQSCSADSDQDGLNDSCDGNDMSSDDGCFGCGIPRMRTNGLFWAYGVIFLVLRQRRHKRA